MGLFTFEQAVSFLQKEGYIIIFLLMVIEGPIITTAASFLASAGFFSIYLIFVLSLFADLTADIMYYTIGRATNKTVIEKKFQNLKGKKSFKKIEAGMNNHLGKTLLIVKLTPFLAIPGLLLAGALKVSIKKFTIISLAITIPRTIFLTVSGFYFGYAVNKILMYFELGQYIFLFLIIAVIIIYFIFKFISSKIEKSLKA